MHCVARTQEKVVSLDLVGTLARGRLRLCAFDDTVRAGDLGSDLIHNLVLDQKDIGHLAIVAICPDMGAGFRIDELGRDAKAIVGEADATLKHVTHAKLAPKLCNIDRLALELKGGVAGEYAEVARP